MQVNKGFENINGITAKIDLSVKFSHYLTFSSH